MTFRICTRSTDGAELDWSLEMLDKNAAICTALELAGPGATVVRVWQEGEW